MNSTVPKLCVIMNDLLSIGPANEKASSCWHVGQDFVALTRFRVAVSRLGNMRLCRLCFVPSADYLPGGQS